MCYAQLRFKKRFTMKMFYCLLMVISIVFVFNSANAEVARPFHWVDDEDSPPLISRGPEGQTRGIFYEIMTEAFRRLSIPLVVETYPWVRAQKLVIEGKADGVVTVLTIKRKPLFRSSDPILLVTEHIFANKNNKRIEKIMSIHSLDELKPFKVVEVIGSGWTEEVLKGVDITWVPQMDNAFNMLLKGRVDIYIANGFTGAEFIRKKIKDGDSFSKGYKCIIINPYPLRTIAFRLLIRKTSPFVNIIDEFNRCIHQMQKDGTIQHIINTAGQ